MNGRRFDMAGRVADANTRRRISHADITRMAEIARRRGDADHAVGLAARMALDLLLDPDADEIRAAVVVAELRAALNWRDSVAAEERTALLRRTQASGA